jgi:putative ABC transport system permease protein
MAAVRAGSPAVEALSPKANNWFVRAVAGRNLTRVVAVGVEPEYADIVHVALEPGSRWIDANDLAQELPVCVLGWGARAELFGDEPYLGQEVAIGFSQDPGSAGTFRKLTVIGALTDEELAGDEIYTSHRRVVFVPFTTWERMSPRDFQFFVLRPRSEALKREALAEVRAVLGRRHGFDATNENTLVPYFDAYERRATLDRVFGGLELFLGAVGALILLLGAVGVANVVLMSVAARTFEFGLRRALGCKRRWIFAQVFLEAALVCVVSGGLGFTLGLAGVALMGRIDLPEGFAPPEAELGAALLPGVLLLAVSLGAAAWPATRAALLPVVRALYGGRL